MQVHIRKVNSMFADERKKVSERYKEYEGCYLSHYTQWFVWFFFVLGFFGFLQRHCCDDSTALWEMKSPNLRLRTLSQAV